jgi:hypothetical protein
MTIDDIIDQVAALDGVLVLRPEPGDGSPQISWGDVFLYYAPTGEVPPTQPFATIVTKDYADEPASGLDRPGAFRLNIAVPASVSAPLTATQHTDSCTPDAWFPHPVYGRAGWISVVDPAEHTSEAAWGLLEAAHDAARRRYQRHLPE